MGASQSGGHAGRLKPAEKAAGSDRGWPQASLTCAGNTKFSATKACNASRETGFAKHITKPVDLGALAKILETQLAAKGKSDGLE